MDNLLTITYALLFYLAALVFTVGTAYKIYQYASTPVPLKIPTTPAPNTRLGVAIRMLREIILFESLFRADKWLWLLGWLFHVSLLLVMLRHLRYFTEPVWTWVVFIQPYGKYASFILLISLLGLLLRRIMLERVRYISAPSDYLMLILLLVMTGSGMLMTFVIHTDIVQFKAFMLGVLYFNWQPLPTDFLLLLHLTSFIGLLLIFPFSKLLHAPGVFFSPTRNQVDNPREHRYTTHSTR